MVSTEITAFEKAFKVIIAPGSETNSSHNSAKNGKTPDIRGDRQIKNWLIVCCTLVFVMISVGAITRLTESGLSIVQWKLATGIIPPITETQWQAEFEEYKSSPEFRKKNFWMSADEFKNIYFWEWFHRLLGRVIGLAYALPFLYFLYKNALPQGYKIKLALLVLLVGAQGLMGWYMVKSGLIDEPAVSHFRLAAHLGLALLLYALTLWHILAIKPDNVKSAKPDSRLYCLGFMAVTLLSATILWGAFTAGLDAGLIYNDTFPMMGGRWIPEELNATDNLTRGITETHAGVQFTHRWLAILTTLFISFYALYAKIRKKRSERVFSAGLAMVLLQFTLGILTLFTGVHILPAVLHQMGAVILLSILLTALYKTKDHRKLPRHD